jgi:hypothetical protein
MCSQLVVAVVMVSRHRRLYDRAVHPLDLAISPWVVWLGQAVLDPIYLVDHVAAHPPRIFSVPVAGLLGEPDAVIGQDRVNAIGDGLEQMFEELPRGLAIWLFHELGDCKLAGAINAHKKIELALCGLNLGDVDMKETDWVSLEPLPL